VHYKALIKVFLHIKSNKLHNNNCIVITDVHCYSLLKGTVPSSYNCIHTCDILRGTMRICNLDPPKVKAMVHDHESFKSTCGLKPSMI